MRCSPTCSKSVWQFTRLQPAACNLNYDWKDCLLCRDMLHVHSTALGYLQRQEHAPLPKQLRYTATVPHAIIRLEQLGL